MTRPEVLAQVAVRVEPALDGDLVRELRERAEPADDEDRRPDAFDDIDDVGEELVVRHAGR